MNAKVITALLATFVMLFAGVAVADSAEADAETAPVTSGTVSYVVGEKTFQVPFTGSANITLKTLEDLGATTFDGLEFKYWSIASAQYLAGSTYIATSESVEFKAVFAPVSYTTTFIGFDSDGEEKVLKEVTGAIVKITNAEKVTTAPATPINLTTALKLVDTDRDGYIFIGWLAEGSDKIVATEDLGILKGNVKYIAQYVVDYDLTFVDGDTQYMTCVSEMKVPDLGERAGFTFLGWFATVGEKEVMCMDTDDFKALKYVENTTFTAKWEPVNCYVTFVAGDFSKTVPVLYGETVGQLALPEGFESWDFDFTTPITKDVTIDAVPMAPAEPEGLDDPVTQTVVILGGLLAIIIFALLVSKVKKGEIVVKLKKDKEDEE